MKKSLLCGLLVIAAGLSPWSIARAAYIAIPYFKITSTSVSGPHNFHFRVSGVTTPECTFGFVFVDEADQGAKVKIANLMSAYYTGKRVGVLVDPVNYYGDGRTFCQVIEFQVAD